MIDVELTSKEVAYGVTVKFFFNYKEGGTTFEQITSSDGNIFEQVFKNVIIPAVDPKKRGALYSKELLSFIPRVSNLTSGDDMSERIYWEQQGVDIRLNQKD